ncbi:hypothetical protein GP486_005068 [Trichoglossum hirsutum]|uniref:BZIP transcription factor n=1 Tax=Trichoglossum hirsutum TaxID=265104 RepID=A0A9P8RMY3_9PEZI|nr:hypothetical protein GP486_005068 [Trichoglossum hirsutum]
MSPESDPTPPLAAPVAAESRKASQSQSSSRASSVSDETHGTKPQRPKPAHRRCSESIIVDRNSPFLELTDEVYDEDDARTMSPRRNSRDVQKMGEEARRALEEQARSLHSSLLALVDRVESVKSEHDKLEGENKFLQSYIGELMSTSKKIIAAGANKGKGKGSRAK